MKFIPVSLIVLLSSVYAFSQGVSKTEILTPGQIGRLFDDSVKRQLDLNLPIFKVYRFRDNSGEFLCVLMESKDSISNFHDTVNRNIIAVCYRIDKGSYIKSWGIKDGVKSVPSEESSICFWTSYIEFEDFDKDGVVEPIIVYGTSGINGYDNGRIKIIVFYRGKKYAIRHQNGVLDFERKTEIDKGFYSLPVKLKESVKSKMISMVNRQEGIFTKTL